MGQSPTLTEQHGLGICLVAHNTYGAMAGGSSGFVGGVERQTSLMARWLAGKGHAVSMLTWDEGQPDNVIIDGVRVIKVCGREAGLAQQVSVQTGGITFTPHFSDGH
jgi:hypothetical protein